MSLLSETSELANEKKCNSTILERPDIKCSQCNSKKFSKNGTRKHKHKESSQTYKCSNCKHRFTHNHIFKHKRHKYKTIIFAVLLFSVYIPPTVHRPCLKTTAGMYILPPYPGGQQHIVQCSHHMSKHCIIHIWARR